MFYQQGDVRMTLKEKIREIIREGYNYPDETTNKILKAIEESLPKERMTQIGDSQGMYRTKGYVCIHGINLTRFDKLCIECANDKGFNQALKEVKEGVI